VIHDWGAALGFHRTARFPASVQGVCYMEAMVRPRCWTDMPPERQAIFKRLRGAPADIYSIVKDYSDFMSTSRRLPNGYGDRQRAS
jgi:pimeloyl-ACP methyl ester carboxylesterase